MTERGADVIMGVSGENDNPMKKISTPTRKHGRNAQRVHMQTDVDTRQAGACGARLKTLVTFESNSQAYLWITDRGRSRLIKH